MDAGDTWSTDVRSTKPLTSIGLCCNNATGAPTFDYVAYNIEISDEDDGEGDGTEDVLETSKFTTSNTVSNDYVMIDTENGLQITGSAWQYAMHSLAKPIAGEKIETVTVRYKVTGGESAIMKFFSGEEFFYVELNGATGEYVVNQTTDDAGFTILTMDFQKISMDAGDTWLPEERATSELTAMGLCCNNATVAPTFDYATFTLK